MDYIFDILCEAEAETQLLDQFLLQYVRFACTYDRAHDLCRIVNMSSSSIIDDVAIGLAKDNSAIRCLDLIKYIQEHPNEGPFFFYDK